MPSPSEQSPFKGKYLSVKVKDGWEFVSRNNCSGVVVIMATTPSGALILVEQKRIPLGAPTIELPAGLSGDIPGQEHEALKIAAIRELEEETGWRAKEMDFLFEGPVSSGLTNEIMTFFLAGGLEKVSEGGGDASENITVHEVPLQDVPSFLEGARQKGKQVDPKIYSALYVIQAQKKAL